MTPLEDVDFKARVAETQTWFHQTREEQRAFQEELAKRDVELTMRMADIEKAQEEAANFAAAAEAARRAYEEGGPRGPEPTRFGDWERKGIAVDF